MPAFTHGKDAVFKLQGAGGGAMTDLSPYLTSEDFHQEGDLAEHPGMNRASVDYLVGQYTGTIMLSGKAHPTAVSLLGNLAGSSGFTGATRDEGVGFDFAYGPRGSAAGAERISGKCLLEGFSLHSNMGGAAEWDAQLRTNSKITHGVW